MKLLTERAAFLVDCLDLDRAAQVDGAKWERFQIDHLNDDGLYRIEDKSRQIAWSFTVAAEAVALALLNAESTVIVSINLDEAAEKVRYAKRVYDCLTIGGLPRITRENVLLLEFDNGARILSLPSRPPRGKAQMNVVLDEFAHVQRDREIYTAAMPIISRGGKMRIGSSTMGARGTHWEISQQALKTYSGFNRVTTAWWDVAGFCSSPAVGAEMMPTAERVERFGNTRIVSLFENMLLDDFQQEYECIYVDESVSFFPWSLIRKNQDNDLLCHQLTDVADLPETLRLMKSQIAAGQMESEMVGGVDVGRKRHLTEITICGVGPTCPIRLTLSLDRQKFDVQENAIRDIMGLLPVTSVLIDQNGLGMHLAENLEWDTVAEGVTFTNASKEQWASDTKIRMERTLVIIPNDRDLAYQIHSIKKKITAAKNNVFDTEKNEKHHADKFWSLALAQWAARESQNGSTGMEIVIL